MQPSALHAGRDKNPARTFEVRQPGPGGALPQHGHHGWRDIGRDHPAVARGRLGLVDLSTAEVDDG